MSKSYRQVSIVGMASAIPLNKASYTYLEPHPNSFYRELFVRGVNLRASRLVAWMQAEGLSPDLAAADRGLPIAAVLEAIEFCGNYADLIEDDLRRERDLLKQRGLICPDAS